MKKEELMQKLEQLCSVEEQLISKRENWETVASFDINRCNDLPLIEREIFELTKTKISLAEDILNNKDLLLSLNFRELGVIPKDFIKNYKTFLDSQTSENKNMKESS